MRRNRLVGIVVVVIAVFATSCAEGPAEDAPPDNTAPQTLTGETLRYGIADGTELVYDMTMSMDMVTDMRGAFVDQANMGAIEMDMDLSASTAYEVSEGIEDGTYLVSMSFGDFSFDSLSMTMGGEDLMAGMDDLLDDSMSAEMAGLSEMKFVIDEQGQMLGVTVDGQSVDFGNLSAGSQFGGFGSGTPFLGPELPDGVVAEGDTWSTTWDTEFVPGREISVSADSRVLAVEGDVYVIETETTTSAIEMTMDDLLAASSTEEFDMTELAGMGDMSMTMSMDATTGTSTVWFDVSRGIPVRQEWSGGSTTSMTMNAAGESGAMDMEMSFSGTLELRG
jgi:hypothetical protein